MIALNELRVGNWGLRNGYERFGAYMFASEENKYFSPIPLTAELVKQSGFEEIGTGENPDTGEKETVYNKGEIYLSGINGSIYLKIGMVRFPVATLHRLQNLYFDLTGEELDVNF